MKTATYIIFSVLLAATAADEVNVPRVLFGRQTHCAGEDLRLSCSDDGAPFMDYKMTSVLVKIYAARTDFKECHAHSPFSSDTELCTKDYLSTRFGEYAGLGYQITTQCTDKTECFIRLPSAKTLQSEDACDGYKSYFYGVEIEFTCAEPEIIHVGHEPTTTLSSQEKTTQVYHRSTPTTTVKPIDSKEQTTPTNKPTTDDSKNLDNSEEDFVNEYDNPSNVKQAAHPRIFSGVGSNALSGNSASMAYPAAVIVIVMAAFVSIF